MSDKARIAIYQAERDKALSVVRDIDERGWRFSEGQGDGPMQDVTAARRADQQRVADMMESLIKAWEKLSA